MNATVMNVQCWFESLVAWLRQPAKPKAAAKAVSEEKPRVRIAGLR
jgi:hypothetical protein